MALYILSGLSFALSAFFAFALVGYRTIALLFLALGGLLLLFRLCTVKKLRKTRIVICIVLALGVLVFILLEIPIVSASRGDSEPEAEYLIVLGAGLNGSAPSLSLLNRLHAALEYLERYPNCVAVVSGGQGEGEDKTEAEVMARWLVSRGIDTARVLIEDRATSTYENIAFSLEMIEQHGGSVRPIAICSSEYHLYRAEYLGKRLGVSLLGVPARTTLPVLKLNYFIREAFCMAYYRLF